MKKIITLSFVAFTGTIANAQLPVSQVAGKKQVLIEEFTGNNCQFCPLGHQIADQIAAANPGKAFVINLHEQNEPFANPSNSNAKDFRVPEADNLLGLPNMLTGSQLMGYPAGCINRVVPTSPAVPYNAGGYLMDRQYWTAFASTILNQNAYANVAGQASVSSGSRNMTINMEVYYTANSPVASNRITIALTQNNVLAYQLNGSSYPAMVSGSLYKHNHALRDILTSGASLGVLGETMTGANTSGTKWTKTFTFTVPASYPASGSKAIPAVLQDLELIAFITETSGNVIAVCKVPLNITTDIADQTSQSINFVNIYPNPMPEQGVVVFTTTQPNAVNIDVLNALGQVVKSDNLDVLNAGEHKYELDSSNLTNGIYFVTIKVGETSITKKISVLK